MDPLLDVSSPYVVPLSDSRVRVRELSTRQVWLGGRPVSYTIRASRRARRVSLTIRPDTGLVVTAPPGCPQAAIDAFLVSSERWIRRQTERLASVAERLPRRWPYGSTLPYRGRDYPVVLTAQPRRAARVRLHEGQLVVEMARPGLEGARRVLRRWYIEEATRCLRARADALGEHLGIAWRRLRVRDQRRRWGSCSVAGNLSFNYRLVMAPPEVLDYVVIHELMHRRQLNHSRRFWALVAEHCPGYRGAIAWLKTYGPYLAV